MKSPVLPVSVHHTAKAQTRDYIKYGSMGVLIFQTTALVLLMRYSRTVGGPMYSAGTAVFMMEVVKVVFCLGLVYYEKRKWKDFTMTLYINLLGQPMETLKMFIPAAIYAVQNNLLFVALSNLDAAVYQVTYQLKILTTALCSVVMLNKQISRRQWFALLLLMAGVTLVQLELQSKSHSNKQEGAGGGAPGAGAGAEKGDVPEQSPAKGLAAVLSACFSSGFAGVYFEKVIKQKDANIWIRNIQLGLFGALFSLITVMFQDYDTISKNGFLYGYNITTWLIVLIQAIGGLVVALVIKYADNVLKGFASSVSIVLSATISLMISEFSMSFQFLLGACIVMASVSLYSSR